MSSWFYKLRRKRSATGLVVRKAAAAGQNPPPPPSPKTPSAPCSPNRASYYFPSKDRALSPRPASRGNPRLRDTRSPQPAGDDIVFDVRFGGGLDEVVMHELKLRPIITKTKTTAARAGGHEASDSGSSSAASPTATMVRRRRLHARAAPNSRRKTVSGLPPAETCSTRRRRDSNVRWLHESVVLVKESAEPEADFLASMAEMIAANDDAVMRSPRGMEELLACYLALNAAEHHGAIVSAFRRAWLDCVPPPSPPPPPPPPLPPRGRRCHLHARCI